MSPEEETRWARLIKEADDVCLGGGSGDGGDFSEPPVVVGGALPEVGAFGGKVRREGVDETETLLAVEFSLGEIFRRLAVTSVAGKVWEQSASLVDEDGSAEVG